MVILIEFSGKTPLECSANDLKSILWKGSKIKKGHSVIGKVKKVIFIHFFRSN